MIIAKQMDLPFEGCEDCQYFLPGKRAVMHETPEGEAHLEYVWACENERKCEYIVRKAIGDDEFERLINEVTK